MILMPLLQICIMGEKKGKIKNPTTTWMQFSVEILLLWQEKEAVEFSYTVYWVFRKKTGTYNTAHLSFWVGARDSEYKL